MPLVGSHAKATHIPSKFRDSITKVGEWKNKRRIDMCGKLSCTGTLTILTEASLGIELLSSPQRSKIPPSYCLQLKIQGLQFVEGTFHRF